MSKELREMLQALEEKKAKVRGFLSEDKMTDAENLMTEVRNLQKKIDMQQELEMEEIRMIEEATPINKSEEDLEAEYRRIFLKGLKRQRITPEEYSVINQYQANVVHEGGVSTDPDGDLGIIVPEDIQTRINKIMRTMNDLSGIIRTERVNPEVVK